VVLDALILGIDTTGPADNVALVRGEQTLATLSVQQRPSSSRPLLRLIDTVCTQADCGLDTIAAIAVNVGPGAFTGLRVGLSTAHGLALAYDKPLIGCTAFEALVPLVTYWRGVICPVVEARKGEVYAAFYRCDGDTASELHPGRVMRPEVLCQHVQEPTLFLGSGAVAYRDVLRAELGTQAICLQMVEAEMGLAVSVAHLGRKRWQAAGSAPFALPQPLYIRQADARLPRIAADAAGVAR
jgi:tRNA threonylcarbamoyladenosine biosynthesis protein TsaB